MESLFDWIDAQKSWFDLVLLSVILVFFIGFGMGIAYYRKLSPFNRHRRISGYTKFRDVGFYDFVSFDGGIHWYSVEVDEEGKKVKILGPANRKHTGLVEEITLLEPLEKEWSSKSWWEP